MAAVTRWWLMRHAPVSPEHRGSIVGWSDVAADTSFDPAPYQACLPSDAVWVVSPLRRARETAQALGGVALRVVPGFKEQHFGDWEGKRWEDLAAKDARATRFLTDYHSERPPAGESLADVHARCLPEFFRLSQELAGRDMVAILHAGPIRCILAEILEIPLGKSLRLSIAPLSLSRIEGVASAWQLICLNHTVSGGP